MDRSPDPVDETTARGTRMAKRRGPLVLIIAAVAVAVAAGVALGSSGGSPATADRGEDPTATLEAARSSGTPAYVLIHSLT